MLVENVSLSRYLLSREGQDIGRRSYASLCPVRATDHSPGQGAALFGRSTGIASPWVTVRARINHRPERAELINDY